MDTQEPNRRVGRPTNEEAAAAAENFRYSGLDRLVEVRMKITVAQRKYIRLHQYQQDFVDKHAAVRNILQGYMIEHPQVYQRKGHTNENNDE